jgi:uncharacterized membrane protein
LAPGEPIEIDLFAHLKYEWSHLTGVTDIVLAALVFAHVLAAMGWLGGGLLTTFAVGPNLRKLTQTASLEFNARILPNMIRFTRTAAVLTVLFGLSLLGYVYSQDNTYFSSTAGTVVSVGIVFAVITVGIAFSMILPSFMKISKLAASALDGGQVPPQEMMALAKRARMGSMIALVLLLGTLAAMVTASVS